MWYTTRYEGFDSAKHRSRSAASDLLFQTFMTAPLRAGLLLKLFGITGLVVSYYFYEGRGVFNYDLNETTEDQRGNQGFQLSLLVFSGLYLIGAIYVLVFQSILADDASWSRGFRSGSKLLGNAAFLDVVSSTLQFIIYAYMLCHYDKTWWVQFTSGGTEWLLYTLARLLQAFSLYYYGSGLFLLEVYHDTGTNDWHGVLNACLFTVAGVAEILVLAFISSGSLAVVLHWITLMSALVWAMAFEQEVNASSPLLHEAELTNEIETQVEKLARSSPYLPA